ncbi:MAG: hypothetical protein ACLTW9_01475 [Enterocloster sp.]
MTIFDEVDDSDLPEKAVENADIVYIGSACSFNPDEPGRTCQNPEPGQDTWQDDGHGCGY